MSSSEKTLRKLLDKILDERHYEKKEVEIEEINTNGANYTAALFSINVKESKRELKLFAKVATISESVKVVMNSDYLYRTESFVYNELAHLYNDLQKDLDEKHKFIFPKCYGCSDEAGEEAVVMENLMASGYKPYDRFKSMTWDHGRIGVENLARFHALSFALRKRDPEYFDKITENMMLTFKRDNFAPDFLFQYVKLVENSVQVLKSEYHDKVKRFMYRVDLLEKMSKPIGTPVITHGDFKTSNLMFKREGGVLKARVVDYQGVQTGCPVSDLLYFIFLGSDEEFRRYYYHKLIDHYYISLKEALIRLSLDPREVYPREKFESDLKELQSFTIFTAVFTLPMLTVQPEFAPKWDIQVNGLSSFSVEPNDLYSERFNGIMKDLVRWGVI